ncbi:MAG: ATP-binding protein [Sandaracinus sp.]
MGGSPYQLEGSMEERLPRVICADDHEDNRTLIAETLAGEAIELVSCASGDAAIEAFREGGARCLLLDVRMPGRDGFATLEAIRALPGGAEVPTLFLTALRDVDTFDRARELGAEFVAKPIRADELAGRVRTLLQLAGYSMELRAHHAELARQRDELVRMQLLRELMSAFLVHDLKSPAAAIQLHAELLLRDPSLSADARDSAAAIPALAQRTTTLTCNILDLTKADEGQLRIERRDVAWRDVVRDVASTLALSAREREVTLSIEVARDAIVSGDADMLRRVLENLVENALRHAPPRSSIQILGTVPDGSCAELRVRDRGPGISPSLRPQLFERFGPREPTGGSRRGHGLGLPFCRVAVELHGGSIDVEPDDRGACFVVRLPLARPTLARQNVS